MEAKRKHYKEKAEKQPRHASGPESSGNAHGSEAAEPAAAYRSQRSHLSVVPLEIILEKRTSRAESKMTPMEKMRMVEDGISKTDLEQLKEKAGLDYDQLAHMLHVARATLINKKGADTFSEDISEKILQLADLYSYGYEVFEDRERFNAWIFRSNRALGGKAPYELLHNTYGREEVRNIIGRIAYGVYS
jgi:putative toxin-antitoxin system antitoxin component (TIGR02293 family)